MDQVPFADVGRRLQSEPTADAGPAGPAPHDRPLAFEDYLDGLYGDVPTARAWTLANAAAYDDVAERLIGSSIQAGTEAYLKALPRPGRDAAELLGLAAYRVDRVRAVPRPTAARL